MPCQPWQVEHFPAGTLRAFGHKERITEQCIQQHRFYVAAGSPLAVTVKVVAALLVNPGVQQHITWATVETGDRLAGPDKAEVAEAANVQHCAITSPLFKQGFVKGGNQRCALSAGSDIAAAEIADHGDAGQLRQKGRVANLHCETACRFVADGLAMTANRTNALRLELLLGQEGINALRGQFYPVLLGDGGAGNLVRPTGAQAKQLGAQ
ncbi:hypothetical protein D3C81_1127440 [compost metagenome]